MNEQQIGGFNVKIDGRLIAIECPQWYKPEWLVCKIKKVLGITENKEYVLNHLAENGDSTLGEIIEASEKWGRIFNYHYTSALLGKLYDQGLINRYYKGSDRTRFVYCIRELTSEEKDSKPND